MVFFLLRFLLSYLLHKMSDRRHCMPQVVLMTWHLSIFFNHWAICKCTHVHFSLCSQSKWDWQGYWENPPCPPPPTPRTLSPCLSAGDMPVSGCFSYPLQCRIQPDVTMMSAAAAAAGSSLSPTPQLLMTPAPHSASTSTSVKWGFQKSDSKPSNSPTLH